MGDISGINSGGLLFPTGVDITMPTKDVIMNK
jgi:hypothetical protein